MSEKIEDGGPAFPTPEPQIYVDRLGMSLRDWFAGQALAGILGSGEFLSADGLWVGNGALPTAEAAYLLADAMIAARKAGA